MKTVDVSTGILIKRSRGEVSTYASDPDNATQWYENIESVSWKTPKPLRVGSQIAFTARFLGERLEYVYEIVELIPNEKFVMRTADGPFPMETTYTWSTVSDGETQMTLRNRGTPTGFSKLFAPFMAFAMRMANKKDLKKLKQVLENKNGIN
jgi:hypothetical protein